MTGNLLTFLHNIPDNVFFAMEDRVYLACNSRLQSVIVGKSMQELKVANYSIAKKRENKACMLTTNLVFSSLMQFRRKPIKWHHEQSWFFF